MHNLSSRDGAGNKISILELVAPRAIESGVEYYLSSEGTVIAESEVLPVVMLPRVGGASWQFIPTGTTPQIHQESASAAYGNVSTLHSRVELTAPYAVYVHYASSIRAIRAAVMNELTGERIAELSHVLSSVPASQYYTDIVALVPTGVNKVGVLCSHTTDTQASKNLRVVELTFNTGTFGLTAADKTALGTATAAGFSYIAAGRGVSLGKVAVTDGASRYVVNLVANTINTASGLTGTTNNVEDNIVVTLGATNLVSVTNLETNGAAGFTVTGGSWTGTPSTVIRIHPRVYLILQGFQNANSARLLVINPGFTAGVVTILTHPTWPGIVDSLVALKPSTSSNLMYLVEPSPVRGAATLTISVDPTGVVLQGLKAIQTTDSLRQFTSSMLPTAWGRRPFLLDVPVVCEVTVPQNTVTQTADSYAIWFVKYRADFVVGPYKPVYLGRALAAAGVGVKATFASSPALLDVNPTQTAFQRVGRVIKVNDLKGFFLEAASFKFGLESTTKTGSSSGFNFGVDEASLNYPIVFGGVQPVEGKVTFSLAYLPSAPTYNIAMVTPLGAVFAQILTVSAASSIAEVELNFSGFAVIGIRLQASEAAQIAAGLAYEVEELDYV